ncbi:MAG: HDOD domain-containing protein [Thermodesulfobacteriota bacterium]|nr:HDOD domain-containing protein [Thermodesulfobacteriota bacterium]
MEQMPQGERTDTDVPLGEGREGKVRKIIELVGQSEISSIQSVVSGVIKVINDRGSSAKDLKDIIEIDPPLTAKVLKVANSAYYYSPARISEIQHAVIWIGFDALKEIVLSQKVWEVFGKDDSISGYSRASLWKHSVGVALLGKMIYRREFGERGENVYAAGLLHDIGIIVEHQFLEKKFEDILRRARTEKKNLSQIESEVLSYSHTDLGRVLAQHWNFPEEFGVGIGHHHSPEGVGEDFSRFASTLYVADCLCQERGIGYADAPYRDSSLFRKCLRKLDVKGYALDLIVKDVEQEVARMEDQGVFQYEAP